MRRDILIAIVLVLVTFAAFSPTLTSDFVQWDDNLNITGNPKIQKLDGASLKWMFTDTGHMRRYVPLAWLNWATLHHFFGLNPRVFHFQALLLHALNAILVFWLIRLLLRLALKSASEEAFTFCASAGALLWAIHPLRVEIAAWANCQIYAQALFFLLGSLSFYLRSIVNTSSTPPRQNVWFWISVLLFACSLLTYPIGIAFVAVLLVLDVYPLRRMGNSLANPRASLAPLLLEKIPFIFITLTVAGITLWARANMSGIWEGTSNLQGFGWAERTAQAFYIWAYYLWKPWLPFDLSPVYTQLVSFRAADWPFLVSVAVVMGGTAFFIWQKRRWPWALALWICHLALLVPMLGLTEHPHYPNDRYNYVSSILWSVLIAGALIKVWPQFQTRMTSFVFGALVMIALGAASFQQTKIWRNSSVLFEAVIAKLGNDPYRCDTWWRLGSFHAGEKRFEEAKRCYLEALKVKPDFATAYLDLAGVFFQQGKMEEAAGHYRQVLHLAPEHSLAAFNLALVLDQQGKPHEAAKEFEKLLAHEPNHAEAHLNLAVILGRLGRDNEAVEHIFTSVRLNPDSAEANYNAGNAMMSQQKISEGLAYFSKAVALKPAYPEALYNLGTVLAMSGKVGEALPHFSSAAKYKPDFMEAHFACGMALEQLGNLAEAKKKFQDAFDLAKKTGRLDFAAQIESRLK